MGSDISVLSEEMDKTVLFTYGMSAGNIQSLELIGVVLLKGYAGLTNKHQFTFSV